jgi:hypothetical protein
MIWIRRKSTSMGSPVMVSAIYQVFNLIMEFDTA